MLTPATIGRLRGTAVWSSVQWLHRRIGPRLCAAVHMMVGVVGLNRVPVNVALKHTYDYEVIYLDPTLLDRFIRAGAWAKIDGNPRRPRLVRFHRWLQLGGGWKNLQRHVSRNLHGRFVVGGDWDLKHRPFTVSRTIIDLFVAGVPPRQTAEYQGLRGRVIAGELGWARGCRTVEDVDRYFEKLFAVYDAIHTSGYKTQVELGNEGGDEIRVCIDRHGRPCVFDGGTHRLSIALLLRLERVPVVVKRVHAQWVEACLARYGLDDVRSAIARGLHDLESWSGERGSR